jgi:predicted metal-binding protein
MVSEKVQRIAVERLRDKAILKTALCIMEKVRQKEKKATRKIGIITCSNITQELGCAATRCFKALYAKDGKFARYGDNVELVGIINCAGCPGIFGADKLTNRVRAIAELDVDAIHFSSCLIDFCPFKEKYREMMSEKYPGIDVVFGTHDIPQGIPPEIHIHAVKDTMCQPRTTMVDLIKPFI